MKTPRRRISIIYALAFTACFLSAAAFFLSGTAVLLSEKGSITKNLFAIGAACAAAAFTLTVFLARRIRRTVSGKLNEIAEAQDRFFREGLTPLTAALTEFATGNTSAKIDKRSPKRLETTGESLVDPLIREFNRLQEAIAESIDDFNVITYDPCERVCYVGTDNYLEGEMCGEIMGRMLGGKGRTAILLNSFDKVNHRLRQKGYTNILSKKFPAVSVAAVLETYQIPENTYKLTRELIEKWPDLSGIYVDEASTPHMAAKALKELGKLGSVKLVAHDVTELSVPYIREGSLTTLSQNPYNQGYDPIVSVYNYLITHERPIIDRMLPKADDLEIIDSASVGRFWVEGKGRARTEKTLRSLAAPLKNKMGTPFRVAVILPNDTGFFKLVGDGMRDAAETLRAENVSVSIIVPEELKRGDNSAATTRRYMEREAGAGANAIVVPIFDKNLVGYVNELVKSGVAVATYNSEPIGVRAMLEAVFRNSNYILEASQTLAANSVESMEATALINRTMQKIVESTGTQLKVLEKTETAVGGLLGDVDGVTERFERIRETADQTNSLAAVGQERVSATGSALREIQGGYAKTTALLDSLNQNSRKVKEIVDLMEDLAEQTNLIAINVSILAARAGKDGYGFSVVANDIRNLAKRSADGAVNIATLINATLGDISEVTATIRKDETDIYSIVQSAGQAETSLNDIIEISTENKDTVHMIISAIEEMKKLSLAVRESMGDLSGHNRENTRAITEISANSHEMAAQVGDNAKVSQTLCDMARSQKDVLSQFTV